MKKIILFVFIFFSCVYVCADSPIRDQTRIYINQQERKIEVEYRTGQSKLYKYPEDKLSYDIPLDINEEEEIVLFIRNPDLFNYIYEYKENKKELAEDFKIAGEITKNIENLLALYAASSGRMATSAMASLSRKPPPVTVEGKTDDFFDKLADLQEMLKNADEFKKDTKNYNDNRESIKNWKLPETEKILKAYFKEFWEKRIELTEKIMRPQPGKLATKDEIKLYDKIVAILGIEDKVIEILNKLKKFSDIYMLLGEDDEIGRIRFDRYNRELVVEISATKENENESKNRYIGKTTFFIKPYAPFKLALGPALIFSLAKRDKITLEKADGGFKIVTSKEDFKPVDIAVMITLFPRFINWVGDNVFVEFGINNISTDKIGFLIGFGFNVNSTFYLGLGYGWHRSQVLDGQIAGDILASKDDLKTKNGTIQGIYFHFTIVKK